MLGENTKKQDYGSSISKTRIEIDKIDLNPDQPRKIFNEDRLIELSKSIKSVGQIVPIIVKKNKNKKNNFLLVAGERRWRASKIAGLKTIDVIISDKDERHTSLVSIIENVQREDLNSLEEANAYNSLMEKYSLTHEAISKFTGKSRSYISNTIRIVGLPDDVKKLLVEKQISYGHARALLSAKDISNLAKKVVKEQLNVRQTENLVKDEEKSKAVDSKKRIKSVSDPNISDYEKYLSLKLGYEVFIKDKNGKGTISVKYKSLDQLEEIISIFNDKN